MDHTTDTSARLTTGIRLAVGLLQGVALYLLSHAEDVKAWPATQPMAFAPLVPTALFAPFVILAGLARCGGPA